MTHQEFLSDLFSMWDDHTLADFIVSARDYAARPSLSRTLSQAAEIAIKLAEAEFDERENERERIQQEIWNELDAMRELEAWQRAESERWLALDEVASASDLPPLLGGRSDAIQQAY